MAERPDAEAIRTRLGATSPDAYATALTDEVWAINGEWRQIVLDLCDDNARLAAELAGVQRTVVKVGYHAHDCAYVRVPGQREHGRCDCGLVDAQRVVARLEGGA